MNGAIARPTAANFQLMRAVTYVMATIVIADEKNGTSPTTTMSWSAVASY